MGVDTIADFTAGQDKIELYLNTFNALPFPINFQNNPVALGAVNFASVIDDAAAATDAAKIVYSQATGTLFYNTNGTDAGLGEGDAFAKLTGNPTLTAADFNVSDRF